MGLGETAHGWGTEELTLAGARVLLRLNPGISFCYCCFILESADINRVGA